MAQRMLISFLLIVISANLAYPVNAHTTIGNLNGTPSYYRSNDHELNPTNTFGTAHVPGPLGYVWPGAGNNVYTGGKGFPGYQSPFENFEEPLPILDIDYLGLIPLLTYKERRHHPAEYAIKRGLDFVISLILLIIFSPLLFTVALLIVLDSGLPVFYIQKRVKKREDL